MPKSDFMHAVAVAVCRRPALAGLFRGSVLAFPPFVGPPFVGPPVARAQARPRV
jgi:hypothetical protein